MPRLAGCRFQERAGPPRARDESQGRSGRRLCSSRLPRDEGHFRVMPGVDISKPAGLGGPSRCGVWTRDAGALIAAACLGHLRGNLDFSQGAAFVGRARDLARRAEGVPSYVSPISAWEIGMLAWRGGLQLLIRPQRWFSNSLELPGADMPSDLLIASSYLPGRTLHHRCDRHELGAPLITRDRALLDYGAQGHIAVVAC
jgi:PIN domain nuclease of toxin-antitoxin system